MGQTHSRQLFVHMLSVMLKHRGITVSKPKLINFLSFIEEVCPWFPREGTVNLETWKKVGEQIRAHYTLHGPEKVPVETLSFWTLIRDCLDFDNDELKRLGNLLKQEVNPLLIRNPGMLFPRELKVILRFLIYCVLRIMMIHFPPQMRQN